MKILAIETSCDETAISIIEAKGGLRKPQFKVLKNIVSSQIKVHRPFGGVVPNLAKREHIRNLPLLLKKIMANSSKSKIKNRKSKTKAKNKKLDIDLDIDAVAVTVGPGLEPALWTGIEFAKKLTKDLSASGGKKSVPLVGVNHMEGHLYSFLLPQKTGKLQISNYQFPMVALVVSGGHTILLLMKSLTKWKKLGETRDDAAGEAFDKVARLLNLPYPGGPEIEKIALRQAQGKPEKELINFPRPMLKDKSYDFSFSGLKTAVLYFLRKSALSQRESAAAADVAAAFQQAVIDVLVGKTMRAAREYDANSVLLCGGVAANKTLRKNLEFRIKNLGLSFFVPSFEYNTDNAAMIAAAAYISKLKGGKKLRITAQSNLSL